MGGVLDRGRHCGERRRTGAADPLSHARRGSCLDARGACRRLPRRRASEPVPSWPRESRLAFSNPWRRFSWGAGGERSWRAGPSCSGFWSAAGSLCSARTRVSRHSSVFLGGRPWGRRHRRRGATPIRHPRRGLRIPRCRPRDQLELDARKRAFLLWTGGLLRGGRADASLAPHHGPDLPMAGPRRERGGRRAGRASFDTRPSPWTSELRAGDPGVRHPPPGSGRERAGLRDGGVPSARHAGLRRGGAP